MATVMTQPSLARARRRSRVYVPVAIVCCMIALAGVPHPIPIIHLHAAVFMGWVFLMIAQAGLAASGRIDLHMKVGKFGFAWGIVVILVGWATALSRFGDRIQAGDLEGARLRLFAPLTDMFVFAAVLAAAWYFRDKPEIHKRLIVVGSTVLLIAAVHRMTFLGGRPPPLPQLLAVWLAAILLGMAYDYVRQKIVHPVYLIGIAAVHFLKFGRTWMYESAAWDDFVHRLARFYA